MRNIFLSAVISLALPASVFAAAAMPATTPANTPGASAAKAPAKPAKFVMTAFISTIEGSAQVQLGGSDIWALAKAEQELAAGSQIKTQAGSAVIIGFTDGSKVRVGPNATFKIEEVSNSKIAIFIGLGKLESWVAKMAKRTFQARNPVAVASVRGTCFAMDVISPTNVGMTCFSGGLAVTDNFGHSTPLGAGQVMQADAATGSSAPQAAPAGTTAPVEPVVVIPAAIAAVSAPAPAAEAAPVAAAEEAPAAEPAAPVAAPAPASNPLQEVVTGTSCSSVSPSSPSCP